MLITVMLKPSNHPCWLTKSQLAEAEALLALGFIYCGKENDFLAGEYPLGKVGSWQFSTAPGEITLDAICNGALYSRCLEIESEHGDEEWFIVQVKQAKKAIRKVQKSQKQEYPKQLSLF